MKKRWHFMYAAWKKRRRAAGFPLEGYGKGDLIAAILQAVKGKG
ncbi:MAG TPA: hypothetical protein PKI30_03345 [Bacillota bacterium]|nr:hypothetical protein [Bacillota bacterium]